LLVFKVEAKRAVPRSEVPRETAPVKSVLPTNLSSSTKSNGSLSNGPPAVAGNTVSLQVPGRPASASQSQFMNESKHATDPRINMDEYAYNKIFVGGLHYDTRDGKSKSKSMK
jgi:hypothetical protein